MKWIEIIISKMTIAGWDGIGEYHWICITIVIFGIVITRWIRSG